MKDDLNHRNVYLDAVSGATTTPFMPHPDATDEAFAAAANRAMEIAVDLARALVGAHQAAVMPIVEGDWALARTVFSLSEKYAAWAEYRTPAKGFGTHAWLLEHNQPVRLTQAELEAHPAWTGFGREAGHHPPMRGWLVAPLNDRHGKNWGLLQLSDKFDGDFSEADERRLVGLAGLVSATLEALWEVRNLRKLEADASR